MDIVEAQHKRAQQFYAWAQDMARIDVGNDYALLRCLSHTPYNYGILKNALRKEPLEALRLWLISIQNYQRYVAGVHPPKGMLLGPQGELLPDTAEGKRASQGLVQYWIEESNYRLVEGMKLSQRDWDKDFESKPNGFDHYQVVTNYGLKMASELGWETLAVHEHIKNLDYTCKYIFQIEFGDWLVFPRVDIYSAQKEVRGIACLCIVQAYFQLLRKDEVHPKSLLTQVVAEQQKVVFSPHQLMGLHFVGWRFGSKTHAEEALEHYIQLMRIFNAGIELNLEGTGIRD